MPGGYRDDREALRQKVADAERALGESREEADRLRAKVRALESESEEPPPPSAPPSMKSPAKGVWLAGFGTLVLFLLGPVLGVLVCLSLKSKSQGSVESTGGELRKWTMQVDRCRSGEHQGFFGVDLYSNANERLGVRALVDATRGPLLNVNVPDGKKEAIQFDREKCSKLVVDVKKSGSQVNEIHLLDGTVEFDCSHGKGERVFGKVSFENCQ
jgi:hypothetical protein